MEKYVALLRGINVGGHKKVPMKELKELMENNGYENVKTLLASGNVIYHGSADAEKLQNLMEEHFGFTIPTTIRAHKEFVDIVNEDPFHDIEVHKKIRLYITFLYSESNSSLEIPYSSDDQSFRILKLMDRRIYSVLDLNKNKTPKAMEILEKEFSKFITTRNYNTVMRIAKA